MRAGKLDRVIQIQRFTAGAPDEGGAVSMTWEALVSLRAQLIQSDTTEYLAAAGEGGRTAVVFRTRWLDGIVTGDRVLFEGRPHDVKAIKELGRRAGLELRTEAAEA